MAPCAFADSLRLPDVQQENLPKTIPAEQGRTVLVPEIVDKKKVIITSPETTVLQEPNEAKTSDLEVLEHTNINNATSSPADDAHSRDHPSVPVNQEMLPVDNEKIVPEERIVNVKKPLDVPASKQQRALTIEDILADPMKNNDQDVRKKDSLSLSDNEQKMEFLEGKWRCETDLINLENNSPVIIDFTFDKNGKGTARLMENSGRVFSGSAKAGLKNGILDIKVAKLFTPGSSATYNGSNIQCKQKGATVVCSGKNTGNPSVSWHDASFRRVK